MWLILHKHSKAMGVVYLFRAITGEKDAFLRDYEIDAGMTFLEFHQFIQEELGFDTHQLTSFFIADQRWERGLELTPIDMGNEEGPVAVPMDTVVLEDLIKSKKDRLIYVFDILSNRALYMELIAIAKPEAGRSYPFCSARVGKPPKQMLIGSPGRERLYDDSVDEQMNGIGIDDDEDYGGESSYSDGEFY